VKNKVLLISLAVVLALGVSLVGCAGGVTPPPTGPQGTLNIARTSLAHESFLPWSGGAVEKNYLSGTIYESLTMRDITGNLLQCLATGWTSSTDAKNWTVTIRQGVPFHDSSGSTTYVVGNVSHYYGNVTADDVAYTFIRLADSASVSHIAGGLRSDFGGTYNITPYISIDSTYQLTFHLQVSDPSFMKTYTGPDMMGVVCKSYIQAHGDLVASSQPVGTGPYVKDSQVVGAYIQLRAVNNWSQQWRMAQLVSAGADPTKYYQYLKFWIIPDISARVLGLLHGDYQYIEIDPTQASTVTGSGSNVVRNTIQYLAQTDVVRFGGLDELDTYCPARNQSARWDPTNPWGDNTSMGGNDTKGTYVRRALNYAIDKAALIAANYVGLGNVASVPISIPDWTSVTTPYAYNPSLANSTLDAAGYTVDNNTGYRFSITILEDKRYSNEANAYAIAQYWKNIGINASVEYRIWDDIRAAWSNGANATPNLVHGYCWTHRTPAASGDPTMTINMAFNPSNQLTDYTDLNTEVLRTTFISTLDPAARTTALQNFGKYVNDQACQVFLVTSYSYVGISNTINDSAARTSVNVFDLDENPELIHRV
jgi:ABC-type transport system substrate-binding protein